MQWKLEDAKARLSEVARRAQSDGPQHVTVRGKPAVVVLSHTEYERLTRQARGKPLAELLRHSPIAGLDFEPTRSRDPGRKVKL